MDLDREALQQTFLLEAEDHLERVEERLLELEHADDRGDALKAIFRSIHTLKGNAQAVGFNALGQLSHQLEDLLDVLRAAPSALSAALVSDLLEAIDLLRIMLHDASLGRDAMPPAAVTHLSRLAQHGERLAVSSAPAVPRSDEHAGQPLQASVERRLRSVRVDQGKLDRLLDLVGELTISRERLGLLLRRAGRPDLAAAHTEADRLYDELQELVVQARMVPLAAAFRPLMRVVRDTAAQLGKQARLVIRGDEVEVDSAVVELVREPLTHLIRNSLDHGIESPERRAAAGKDPCGTLILRARQEAGQILVELGDDGAGFDRARILARARERRLVPDGAELGEREILELVFLPGFSTAERVSVLSGRGVGMDVVRRNLEQLRGTVEIHSVQGQGATVRLRFPLTLAIIHGFRVGAGGQTFVLPVASVVECIDLKADEGHDAGGTGVVNLRGGALPFLRLRHAFDIPGERPARETVVVVDHAGGRAGLAVDAVLGEGQAVIKPLGILFRNLPGLSGSTLLGDGSVALLLDVAALIRRASARTPSDSARA